MAKNFRNLIVGEKPASWWGATWREGYFSGNGQMGANVFGGAKHECILLNHAKLGWHGRTNVLPDVSLKMKEVKKAMDADDFAAAQAVLPAALKSKNFRPNQSDPLPLAALKINIGIEKGIKDYSRTLDMENGEVSVTFMDGNSRITRNLFVSRADDVIVLEMKKTGTKSIDAEFYFEMPQRFDADGDSYVMPDGCQSVYEKNYLSFAARNESGLDYGAVAKVTFVGGTQVFTEKSLKIKGASGIMLTAKLFVDSQRDREWQKLKDALDAIKADYDKLKKAHAAIHSKLFNSCKINFGSSEDERHAEYLLQQAYHGDISSSLVQKLWSYGRYLFISATSADVLMQPSGVWNGEYKAQEGYFNNGRLTESYRHALKGNMFEAAEPYFKYFDDMTGSFKDNAMRLFGKHGVFVPSVCAPSTGRLGSLDPACIYNTSLAAIISDFYYKYYLYTQDEKFLKTRALPFMKNTAVFYEEFLIEKDGKLYVPFSCAQNPVPSLYRSDRPVVGKNAIVDTEAARQLFRDLIEAGKIAGEKEKDIDGWQKMLDKLPSAPSFDGVLKPYAENKCNAFNSFGISMLYAAYPAGAVGKNSAPEEIKVYAATAKELLFKKAEEHNAISMANLSSVFSALREKDLSLECLGNVIKGCVVGNMSALNTDWRGMGYLANSVWSSVQLQGNLAVTNAVQDAILSSNGNELCVLPCHWFADENLEVSGMRCEGGHTVSLSYSAKSQTLSIKISGGKKRLLNVRLPEGIKKNVRATCGTVDPTGAKVTDIPIAPDKICEITCKYQPAK